MGRGEEKNQSTLNLCSKGKRRRGKKKRKGIGKQNIEEKKEGKRGKSREDRSP